MVRLKSLGLGLLVVCAMAASLQAQQCFGRNCGGSGFSSGGQYTGVINAPMQQGVVYHSNRVILPNRIQNSGCSSCAGAGLSAGASGVILQNRAYYGGRAVLMRPDVRCSNGRCTSAIRR